MPVPKIIDNFRGQYRFLSNFYPVSICYNGITYPSVEHYFQAQKTDDKAIRRIIAGLKTPGEAKRKGRTLLLVPKWDSIKVIVMYIGLIKKFEYPHLQEKLLTTGDAILIEGNHWGDTYWGVCSGVGDNYLGKMLMTIRQYHKNKNRKGKRLCTI